MPLNKKPNKIYILFCWFYTINITDNNWKIGTIKKKERKIIAQSTAAVESANCFSPEE